MNTAAQLNDLIKNCKMVDCTQIMNQNMTGWPGAQKFLRCPFKTIAKDNFNKECFIIDCGTGTHIDSPFHFFENGRTISDLQPNELITIAVIIDVTTKVQQNFDYQLTIEDILNWESKNGRLPNNCIVIMKTGWAAKFDNEKEYQNHDNNGIMHFPGFSKELALFLINERIINGIGIDTLSLDPGNSEDFACHQIILGKGLFQIENLDLRNIIDPITFIFVAPLKIQNAPECPARVIMFTSN
eukprot:TRINITY_DN649_c2_g2_i1.p1 TRINITY_DN649_c2_g2~~TRINITY_DN649_c2_g2_i1.p1  ORF type:complete len:242 (-),score=96.17 TRINITY_DN649_c2_g2_i1:76-801(-)